MGQYSEDWHFKVKFDGKPVEFLNDFGISERPVARKQKFFCRDENCCIASASGDTETFIPCYIIKQANKQ